RHAGPREAAHGGETAEDYLASGDDPGPARSGHSASTRASLYASSDAPALPVSVSNFSMRFVKRCARQTGARVGCFESFSDSDRVGSSKDGKAPAWPPR